MTPVSDSDQPSDPPGSNGRRKMIDDRTPPAMARLAGTRSPACITGALRGNGQIRELTNVPSTVQVSTGVVVEVLFAPILTADA